MKEAPKGQREFMDAPNAKPSDEQYEDAMSRYGGENFTDVDAKVVSVWRQQHPDWDKDQDDLPEAEADEYEEEEYSYNDENVEYLRSECKKRGLSISGNKSELVARLEEDDSTRSE